MPSQQGPAPSQAWREGRDGLQPSYREWLYPPVAVIVLVLGLSALIGVAYGAAYGAALGWAAGMVLGGLGLVGLVAGSTPLRVDDRVVRAGRARLPLVSISHAEALDAEALRQERRFGDPRDYVVLRAWSSRTGVSIDLADPRDPHPRWLITSRHPDRLAQAINQAVSGRPAVSGETE
jgi:hypothetical protein